MKPLEEKDESKYSCYTKTRCKEPTRLTNDCIIRSQLNRSSKFKLT
uniref:Uncharacterized protein n=1 Tax=Spirodela intermedia TaxID=51605 RepID=A0A8S0XWA4_SPIIN